MRIYRNDRGEYVASGNEVVGRGATRQEAIVAWRKEAKNWGVNIDPEPPINAPTSIFEPTEPKIGPILGGLIDDPDGIVGGLAGAAVGVAAVSAYHVAAAKNHRETSAFVTFGLPLYAMAFGAIAGSILSEFRPKK